MTIKYSEEELQLISLYKEKNKSSTTLMVEHIINNNYNVDSIKELIKPSELINLKFYLDGPIAKDLFGDNIITINQTLGENLINNIEEHKLIKLVDHKWIDEEVNSNLLIIMLKHKKIKLIEKTIEDYLNFEISNYSNNNSYNNFNTPYINNFFSNLNFPLKELRSNIFLEKDKTIDLNHLLDITIKSGKKILKTQNKYNDQTTINDELNAVSTNLYNFLDLSIHFDDINLFKRLFNEIPKKDINLFLNYNKHSSINFNYNFLKKDKLNTSLIENMITSGSYNILNFLKTNNFNFSLKKTFITSDVIDDLIQFDFSDKNIKDLLIFKLIDNISAYGSIAIRTYANEERKLKHLNINEKILNCLTIFEDISHSKSPNENFFKSNYILKISSDLFYAGEKKILEELIQLFPDITEQKQFFYGSKLTLKESQIVIFLFQKNIKTSNEVRTTKTINHERDLNHFANISELTIDEDEVYNKKYDVEAVYNSLKTLLKKTGYNPQEIEKMVLEEKLTKTDTPNRKMKI